MSDIESVDTNACEAEFAFPQHIGLENPGSSDESSFSDSDSDADGFINTADLAAVVQKMMASEDLMEPPSLMTKNELAEDQQAVGRVENAEVLPHISDLSAVPPQERYLAYGLQKLGTIMNIFSNKVILKAWGAKNSLMTTSSSDDDCEQENIRMASEQPTAAAAADVANPFHLTAEEDLAKLTTLPLNSPVFDESGQAVGRIMDIFGHVDQPFFVVMFHNEKLAQSPLETTPAIATTTSPTEPATVNDAEQQDQDDQTVKVVNPKPTPPKFRQLDIPKLSHGQTLCYQPSQSQPVPSSMFIVPGTDASNLYDEEVASDEQEFSDDEAESTAKRALKQKQQSQKQKTQQPKQQPTAKSARSAGGGKQQRTNNQQPFQKQQQQQQQQSNALNPWAHVFAAPQAAAPSLSNHRPVLDFTNNGAAMSNFQTSPPPPAPPQANDNAVMLQQYLVLIQQGIALTQQQQHHFNILLQAAFPVQSQAPPPPHPPM